MSGQGRATCEQLSIPSTNDYAALFTETGFTTRFEHSIQIPLLIIYATIDSSD